MAPPAAASGTGPRAVRNASMVYNPDAGYALLVGGVEREEKRNDVDSSEFWRLQWIEPELCHVEETWSGAPQVAPPSAPD